MVTIDQRMSEDSWSETSSSGSENELSSIEDPHTVLMMVERVDIRELITADPYKCHLNSDSKYATDSNNILHLSRTMRIWLDGCDGKSRYFGNRQIPSILVTAVGQEEAERKRLSDGSEVNTTKVYVKIYSADAKLVSHLGDMLKEGSYQDTNGDWITFVNPLDPDTFRHCLECKAQHTQTLWDENGGCPTGP
jgi:hypothetical protein